MQCYGSQGPKYNSVYRKTCTMYDVFGNVCLLLYIQYYWKFSVLNSATNHCVVLFLHVSFHGLYDHCILHNWSLFKLTNLVSTFLTPSLHPVIYKGLYLINI